MKPSDPNKEAEKGRVALWLDPNDIRFLLTEWRKIPDSVPDEVSESWSRIAFRASSALHKIGLKIEPVFPKDEEKY